jgi:two-component system cell cycle sensor histidine kinase/response regulator CckA
VSTILFVDDHHAFRTVFAEVLRTAGHTVLEAGTGAEAEHLIGRHSGVIDLLLAEVLLTTTNGQEIARRLQPLHPEMRVLFISAQSGEALMQEGLLPRGAHFLREPFVADQLIATLEELGRAVISSKTGMKIVKRKRREAAVNLHVKKKRSRKTR